MRYYNTALKSIFPDLIIVDDEVTPNCVFHATIDALDEAEQFINCMSFYESSEEDAESPRDNIHQQICETIFLLREKATE